MIGRCFLHLLIVMQSFPHDSPHRIVLELQEFVLFPLYNFDRFAIIVRYLGLEPIF